MIKPCSLNDILQREPGRGRKRYDNAEIRCCVGSRSAAAGRSTLLARIAKQPFFAGAALAFPCCAAVSPGSGPSSVSLGVWLRGRRATPLGKGLQLLPKVPDPTPTGCALASWEQGPAWGPLCWWPWLALQYLFPPLCTCHGFEAALEQPPLLPACGHLASATSFFLAPTIACHSHACLVILPGLSLATRMQLCACVAHRPAHFAQ